MNRKQRRRREKAAKAPRSHAGAGAGLDPAITPEAARGLEAAQRSFQSGQLGAAAAALEGVLGAEPENFDATLGLGIVHATGGRLDAALPLFEKAAHLRPDSAEAHYNLGRALADAGRLEDAMHAYLRAIKIEPGDIAPHLNLGNLMKDVGDMASAEECYRYALTLKPDFAEAHSNLGAVLQAQGRHADAVASFGTALTLKPDFAEAASNLGVALQAAGKLDEAVGRFEAAIRMKPDHVEAHVNLGIALYEQGRIEDAMRRHAEALTLAPDDAKAHSNALLAALYRPGITNEVLLELHREWDRRHAAPLKARWSRHANDPDPGRPLTVGLVSPDLGRHPVGSFAVKLLQGAAAGKGNGGTVKYVCFSDTAPDDLTARIQAAAGGWHDIRGDADAAVAKLIADEKIDVLVDLAGHSARNRLSLFAMKPAPVQVAWGGYAATTGLDAIDALIADSYEIPPGDEKHYSEKILRMPAGWLCYEPPAPAPDVGPLPMQANGFVTFAGFHNPGKINAGVIETWAAVMNAVPGSRLILKYRNLDAASNRARIHDGFARHGIEAERVSIEGGAPHAELLARYNDADLALDTQPYSGGVTTLESLWMGVPVLGLAGATFAGRHTLSHMTNLGLGDFVCADTDALTARARALTEDAPALAALRSGLRARMAASPLCDGAAFAEAFEGLLRRAWRAWCGAVRA